MRCTKLAYTRRSLLAAAAVSCGTLLQRRCRFCAAPRAQLALRRHVLWLPWRQRRQEGLLAQLANEEGGQPYDGCAHVRLRRRAPRERISALAQHARGRRAARAHTPQRHRARPGRRAGPRCCSAQMRLRSAPPPAALPLRLARKRPAAQPRVAWLPQRVGERELLCVADRHIGCAAAQRALVLFF
jgi:hypothetical protein